jgi:putative oxidoreductase
MRILNRYSDQIYSLMRLVVGFLYACHGAQKLFGALGGARELHDPLMLIAGIIEFGGGVLIALGLFTTIAAFVASGEMAVAYFRAHAPHGFWPIRNRGELAVLFCFVFLYIASRGDAGWNLRHLMRGKRI